MSGQTATVRTDELRPGDRVWHPFDIVCFTVAHKPEPVALGFEGERGLRVTGTDDRGETVHVDVAPGYRWHRGPVAVRSAPQGPQERPRTLLDLARNALNARMAKDALRHVLGNVIDYAARLEAERHTTNEALDDAVRALRNHDHVAEAYPGELAMLRGLVATLRVVAEHGDLTDVAKLLDEHQRDEQDAYAETGGA